MSGPLDFEPPDDEERRRRLERREDPDQRAERLEGIPPRPGARPPARGLRTWRTPVALLVIFLTLVVVMLNSLGTEDTTPGPVVGERLPPFAAPLVQSSLEGAVNLRRARPEGGGRLACEVRGPRVLNICELAERGPVVLSFFTTRGDECVRQLDVVQRVARQHPDVQFAAVALAGERDQVRKLVRNRGWSFPVGYDEEALLASVYGIAVCPLTVFAAQGGEVVDTSYGELAADELSAQVEALGRRG